MSDEKTKQRQAERCLERRDERLSLARYRKRRRERDSSRECREKKTDTNQLFERVKYYIDVYRSHRWTFQFLFPNSGTQPNLKHLADARFQETACGTHAPCLI